MNFSNEVKHQQKTISPSQPPYIQIISIKYMNICWYFEYLLDISIYQYLVDASYLSHGKK